MVAGDLLHMMQEVLADDIFANGFESLGRVDRTREYEIRSINMKCLTVNGG